MLLRFTEIHNCFKAIWFEVKHFSLNIGLREERWADRDTLLSEQLSIQVLHCTALQVRGGGDRLLPAPGPLHPAGRGPGPVLYHTLCTD